MKNHEICVLPFKVKPDQSDRSVIWRERTGLTPFILKQEAKNFHMPSFIHYMMKSSDT
ncbi:65_t:CDS:2 [Cetraspora pellucida]|uniref:65_t:CDS:1 n=1 Tax=Cetraspora pellucida TaxID=1433469 RepID=A0A9N9FG89_9GLOM|nr:65_t:CDS:2 [Cetraspora pellucida]